MNLPIEFDLGIYRQHLGDDVANGASDADLALHYQTVGRDKGQICSAVSSRATFVRLVPPEPPILEVGPAWWPAFTRPTHNVRYLDSCSREELLLRAAEAGVDPSTVPHIDYVWRGGAYQELVYDRFVTAFSGQTIEHQPCLVTHLQNVTSVLAPNGRYFIAVPDKRYCFDHYLPESTIADILDALVENRARHTLRTVIADQLFHTHNDALRHWRDDRWPDPRFWPLDGDRVAHLRRTLELFKKSTGYIDGHAWQFTPASFRYNLEFLRELGLVDMYVERLYPTVHGSLEFYAVLRRA